MKTPLLFIIFNRPNTTALVFEAIRKIKPEKLFIAADGPRPGSPGEAGKCEAARRIVEAVDWPCAVSTNFSAVNLGCKKRVSSALDWFFDNVSEGIILEDDCLPDQSFFYFCEELLEKYRDEERIMHISGDNFLFDRIKINNDFYFSRFPLIWGWATWRRAWKKYDVEMSDFPEFKKEKIIEKIFSKRLFRENWMELFQKTYDGKIDTWDHQWSYAVIKNKGLCVNPKFNLVSNIGFGADAVHTKKINDFANIAREPLAKIRNCPKMISVNDAADEYFFKKSFAPSFLKGLKRIIKKIISKKAKVKNV